MRCGLLQSWCSVNSDLDLRDKTPNSGLRENIIIDEFPVGHPSAAVAEKVEGAVFLDRFGDTEQDFEREYGPLKSRSVMVVASRAGRVVATTRMAWADEGGTIKTLSDASEHFGVDVDEFLQSVGGPSNVLDALTISALDHSPGSDGRSIGGALTVAMGYLAARKRGCTHVVSFLDEFVFDYLVSEYGVPWRPLPGAKPGPYMGSACSIPAVVDVAATASESFGDLSAITNGLESQVSVVINANLRTVDLTESGIRTVGESGVVI